MRSAKRYIPSEIAYIMAQAPTTEPHVIARQVSRKFGTPRTVKAILEVMRKHNVAALKKVAPVSGNLSALHATLSDVSSSCGESALDLSEGVGPTSRKSVA
jgi:hypothetical protein